LRGKFKNSLAGRNKREIFALPNDANGGLESVEKENENRV
jgi:hypothetical protein